MISSNCTVPDHSIVLAEFKIPGLKFESIEHNVINNVRFYRRYSFQNVSDTFMNNTIWNHAGLESIMFLSIRCL